MPPWNPCAAGTCYFSEKALNAQDAGAAAVLIFDDQLESYFTFGAEQSVGERPLRPAVRLPASTALPDCLDLL